MSHVAARSLSMRLDSSRCASRCAHRKWVWVLFDMLYFAWLCLGLLTAARTAVAPCSDLKSEAAFLKDVVADLPQQMRATFCEAVPAGKGTVHPDETGVSHFVLPGLIPKRLIGEENDTWQVVGYGEQSGGSADSEPAVLHLWLRAACIGCVTQTRHCGVYMSAVHL